MNSFPQQWFTVSPEIAQAQKMGKPIVALESTVISHGMPYPQNLETGRELENIVREGGAVPATMAIMGGKLKIGLSDSELQELAYQGLSCEKVGRRDIPSVLQSKKIGATTVSGTVFLAHQSGIPLLATGGLGGVHREVESSWDISADLTELTLSDVAVVCSGVKSILDIGKTLEVLETLSVPVIGYQTSEFPAFFTRSSGHKVLSSVNSPQELAEFLTIKWSLGLKGGVIVANPIPQADALPKAKIDRIIDEALVEMKAKGIFGKAVTPYLLAKVVELSGGESLTANQALIKNNAKVAAQLAVAYSQHPH